MSKLEHELARRYRKNDETNEEEEVLIRPDEARKCDTLTDAYTGEPLYLRAENSELLRQHFVIKEKKLTKNDKKIKEKNLNFNLFYKIIVLYICIEVKS